MRSMSLVCTKVTVSFSASACADNTVAARSEIAASRRTREFPIMNLASIDELSGIMAADFRKAMSLAGSEPCPHLGSPFLHDKVKETRGHRSGARAVRGLLCRLLTCELSKGGCPCRNTE